MAVEKEAFFPGKAKNDSACEVIAFFPACRAYSPSEFPSHAFITAHVPRVFV